MNRQQSECHWASARRTRLCQKNKTLRVCNADRRWELPVYRLLFTVYSTYSTSAMQRFRIIDGYNLLHTAGFAQAQFGPGGLERSRRRLLRFIASRLDLDERRRTTVVFDAQSIPAGDSRMFRMEEMTILFNEPGSDADTLIEELIRQHSAPKQLEVVSGDRRLQRAIRRRKGVVVESEDFAKRLRARNSVPPGSPLDHQTAGHEAEETAAEKGPIPLSESETEEWLALFGTDEVIPAPDATIPGPDQTSSVSDEPLFSRDDASVGTRPGLPGSSISGSSSTT